MIDKFLSINRHINTATANARSMQHVARQHFVSNRVQWLTIVYAMVIAYVSLHPLTALRFDMPFSSWSFLNRPWVARDVHLFDNLSNCLAYLPLGLGLTWLILKKRFLPYIKWHIRWNHILSLFITTVLSSIFSLMIETLQTYSPVRIAASIDIVCNGLGALLGGLLALFIKGRRSLLMAILSTWFDNRSGAIISVLGLWTLAQINSQGWAFMTAPLAQLSYTWLPNRLHGLSILLENYQIYNLERTACIIALLNILSLMRLSLQRSLILWKKILILFVFLGIIIIWQLLVYVLQFDTKGWRLLFSPATIEGLWWILGLSLIWAILPLRWIIVCSILLLFAHIILAQLLPAHPYMSSSDLWRQARLKHLHGLTNLLSALWPILALLTVLLYIRQLWFNKHVL